MSWSWVVFAAASLSVMEQNQVRSIKDNTPSIYSMDYFIEIVEKIEQHPKVNTKSLETIVNSIRALVYKDDLWDTLLGPAQSIPNDALSLKEQQEFSAMLRHRYFGPIETGVVHSPSNNAISMGQVVVGICAGTRRNTRLSLGGWVSKPGDPVDNLFAATIAGTIVRTGLDSMNDQTKVSFGPGGSWKPNNVCPHYHLKSGGAFSSASDAQLLGDIDGFILGSTIKLWVRKGVRLGQLLRMYYSTGICYDTSYVYCNRASKIKQLLKRNILFGQVVVFGFPFFHRNQAKYQKLKNSDVIELANKLVRYKKGDFFSYIDNLLGKMACIHEQTDQQHCELPANLVFIMDESGSIDQNNYEIEKVFVNKVIDSFHISPYQTRVAVVEYSDVPILSIKLDEYGSKTRLQCAVKTFSHRGGPTHTGKAIQMVNNHVLLAEQRYQLNRQGSRTPQIVVLLTDGKSNDPNSNSLRHAVNQIKQDIRDLTMIAVGIGNYDINELRLIATHQTRHVFEASNFNGLIKLVTSLKNSTCTTPIIVNIDFHPEANETVISAFVSPAKPRYFVVPHERFEGLKHLYIQITPIYGTIALYASRDVQTPGPQDYTHKMDPLDVGEEMYFYLADPCQGYNATNSTCPDLYLAIYGDVSTLSCTEPTCTLPNQIKFTIKKGWSSHAYSSSCQHISTSFISYSIVLAIFGHMTSSISSISSN